MAQCVVKGSTASIEGQTLSYAYSAGRLCPVVCRHRRRPSPTPTTLEVRARTPYDKLMVFYTPLPVFNAGMIEA